MTSFILPQVTYWFWMGTVYLIFLTIKDFKNRYVDDRHNFIMFGISLSLMSHIPTNIWKMLIIMGIIICLGIFLNKFKVLGYADVSSLTWIFMGYGLISNDLFIWFGIFFIVAAVIYHLFRFILVSTLKDKIKLKYTANLPFYPVILVSFWFTNIIFRGY